MSKLFIMVEIDGKWYRLVELPQRTSTTLVAMLRWHWMFPIKLQWLKEESSNGAR